MTGVHLCHDGLLEANEAMFLWRVFLNLSSCECVLGGGKIHQIRGVRCQHVAVCFQDFGAYSGQTS